LFNECRRTDPGFRENLQSHPKELPRRAAYFSQSEGVLGRSSSWARVRQRLSASSCHSIS
jgi:hypothetical protein